MPEILDIFQYLGPKKRQSFGAWIYSQLKGGHAMAQLVEALRYKSEGRGFDSRWSHWNFSLT